MAMQEMELISIDEVDVGENDLTNIVDAQKGN